MEKLKLSDLTPEQCTKITQLIVTDIVRAMNLGNYSLLWRYLTEQYSEELTEGKFEQWHRSIKEQYGEFETFERIKSDNHQDSILEEKWTVSMDNDPVLTLCITFTPVKEFLAIDSLSIED